MGIFSRREVPAKARAEPGKRSVIVLGGNDWEQLLPDYKPLSRDETVLRCANVIADRVSDMTIMLMQNGENGDIRIKDGLAKKVDVYPNKYLTRKNWVKRIILDMMIYGNAVVVPHYVSSAYSEYGELLDDLELLDASAVSICKTPDSYYIQSGARRYERDEVLNFILNPTSSELWRGEGIKPLIAEAVQNIAQANATKKGFLRSKWKPSVIISINADIAELQDPEKRRKILGSYIDQTENGEPWLIPAGELDIKTIQPLTLHDLAIQDGITLDTRTVASALGVPPFMVGIGEFNREAYNNFVSTTVLSYAEIFQQELTRGLLYAPDLYFKCNIKSLQQYSLSEKSAFVINMKNGGMLSPNEARAEFDYSPVDIEGMNDYTTLENYIPVGAAGDQKKLNQNGGE